MEAKVVILEGRPKAPKVGPYPKGCRDAVRLADSSPACPAVRASRPAISLLGRDFYYLVSGDMHVHKRPQTIDREQGVR